MSELISGKEAKLAWANGEKLQWRDGNFTKWMDLDDEFRLGIFNDVEFRLKPRTIKINGVEVPVVKFVAHSGGTSVRIACHSSEDAKIINDVLRSVFNEND